MQCRLVCVQGSDENVYGPANRAHGRGDFGHQERVPDALGW